MASLLVINTPNIRSASSQLLLQTAFADQACVRELAFKAYLLRTLKLLVRVAILFLCDLKMLRILFLRYAP